ncbi:MAG: GNAT family N-acetyltransferase [Acidobacteriota bacterium]
MKIRSVTGEDCKLLWEWANDPEVRAWAFQTEPIAWEQHLAWFRQKSLDPNRFIYIIMNENDQPIGQVRFEVQCDDAEVSISLEKSHRGRGYGVEGLRLACQSLLHSSSVQRLLAYIKPANAGSLKVFEKAGFVSRGREWKKGNQAVCMMLERDASGPMASSGLE